MGVGLPDNQILGREGSRIPRIGIIHLGPGAFFRAFNAVYTAEVLDKHGGDWAIRGVSLRSPDIRNKLKPKNYVFTSVTLSPEQEIWTKIGSINDILVAPEDPAAVIGALADPAIKIVSLTITEKGYCHNPATGQLDLANAEIVHDLKHPGQPRSAVGFIVQALNKRRQAGNAPFTVLSCDNLPDNGALARRIVLEFATALDGELATWIEQYCKFPATMVDRITPATTDADVEKLKFATGEYDAGCVLHEPFRQWVIEDNFVNGCRPEWSSVGAQFVKDVAKFEMMKLRCLNGTHSALAYLGYLAGYETISQAVSDPAFSHLVEHMWEKEIIPTVERPEGENLQDYCAALMKRFSNPKIQHRTWQIAMDGSQKLPQRLLATVTENLSAERAIPGLSLAVAAWMTYVGGVDQNGSLIDVKDPLAARLKSAFDSSPDLSGKVVALLEIDDVFDKELSSNKTFKKSVTEAFISLHDKGAVQAARAIV